MERTKHLRIGITSLFVAYVNPYNAFGKSTISRLIKNILGLAGIDMRGFKPHNVRTSSTSAAALAKVLLDTTLQTAGWSRHCTFAKYCKKNPRTWEVGRSWSLMVILLSHHEVPGITCPPLLAYEINLTNLRFVRLSKFISGIELCNLMWLAPHDDSTELPSNFNL